MCITQMDLGARYTTNSAVSRKKKKLLARQIGSNYARLGCGCVDSILKSDLQRHMSVNSCMLACMCTFMTDE